MNYMNVRNPMAPKAKTRKKLFSIYSKNLSFYRPNLQDKFLCPVCQDIFSQEDLQPEKLVIALAHVVPESIGGKLLTLVCGRCDNTEGHEHDIHLATEKKFFDEKKQNKTEIYGFFKPEECRGINIMIDFAGMREPHPHMSIFNPPGIPLAVWRSYVQQLDHTPGEHKFSLEFKGPALDLEKRNRSLIYAAFLMMFYQFGYEYVLSENGNYLRQVIAGELQSPDFKNAIQFLKWGQMREPFSLPTFAVTRISTDVSFISTLIPFDKESGYIVHLPGFGANGRESYENLLKGTSEISKFDGKIVPYDILPKHLNDPNTKNIGKQLYEKIKALPWDESTC